MVTDSCYARGLGLVVSKIPVKPILIDKTNERNLELLNYLDEAEGLTASEIAELLGCSRKTAKKLATKLEQSSMVRCITVAGHQDVFKLWVLANKKIPKTANEACRLAALSLFYVRAKKEVPEFEWHVIRSPKKNIYAEMSFLPKGSSEKTIWVIDPPRRGEELNPDADVYLFPTFEDGTKQVPEGKRFTHDLELLTNKDTELTNIIYEKV